MYLLLRKQLVLLIKCYHLLPRELCDTGETEKLDSVLSSAITPWLSHLSLLSSHPRPSQLMGTHIPAREALGIVTLSMDAEAKATNIKPHKMLAFPSPS